MMNDECGLMNPDTRCVLGRSSLMEVRVCADG